MNYAENFPLLFQGLGGRFNNQDWGLDYFSSIEALRELVLNRNQEKALKFINQFADLLSLECSEEEWESIENSLLEYGGYPGLKPKESLERFYNLICSIAVQELGLKIDHEYALIPMSSPIVDYPVDYELQKKYKREYLLIYQTIQNCLVEDCILKEKQSYGQKTFLYCRQFYEVEAEEGLKEAQRLKEEKHSDEEWKIIFYSGFGMRYNLDYYELSVEQMLLEIEGWFKNRIEAFEQMHKYPEEAWDKEKMKPNRRKIDTRISSRSVESQ